VSIALLIPQQVGCFSNHDRHEPAPATPPGETPIDATGPDAGSDVAHRDAQNDSDVAADVVLPDGANDGTEGACRPKLDLVVVIDDSGSMEEEQIHLAAQLPMMVRSLADPPDLDGNGVPDWPEVKDLHLGVLRTSVRAPPYTCDQAGDGQLQEVGNPFLEGCHLLYPRFFSYREGVDELEPLTSDFACVAQVGIGGCSLEQPLESVLKGFSGPGSSVTFLDGTMGGWRDSFNEGFLREDSVLGVIVLSDEDDCSYSSEEIVWRERQDDSLPTCLDPEDPLYPIERYVDGFREIRQGRLDRFVFALIGGVPEGLVTDPEDIDYDVLLADPRMGVRRDATDPLWQMGPACVGERGRAYPARRMVEVARELGSQATVASICQESFLPIMGTIARAVGNAGCE